MAETQGDGKAGAAKRSQAASGQAAVVQGNGKMSGGKKGHAASGPAATEQAVAGSVPERLAAAKAGKLTISETRGKHPKNILSELWQKNKIEQTHRRGSIQAGFSVAAAKAGAGPDERLAGHAKGKDKKVAGAMAAERLLEKLAKAGIDIQSIILGPAQGAAVRSSSSKGGGGGASSGTGSVAVGPPGGSLGARGSKSFYV